MILIKLDVRDDDFHPSKIIYDAAPSASYIIIDVFEEEYELYYLLKNVTDEELTGILLSMFDKIIYTNTKVVETFTYKKFYRSRWSYGFDTVTEFFDDGNFRILGT